jgi:DNA-binding response OmpR family regulator
VRERKAGFAEVLRLGPLEFVLHEARAMARGQLLPLRRAEYSVLLYLAQQEGRPVTAGEILNEVLGTRGDGGTVRNHIMALRRALAAAGLPHFICTDRGRGYRVAHLTQEKASHP